MCYTSLSWNDSWFQFLGGKVLLPMLLGQRVKEQNPSQNFGSRGQCQEGKHVMAHGLELNPSRNAGSDGQCKQAKASMLFACHGSKSRT